MSGFCRKVNTVNDAVPLIQQGLLASSPKAATLWPEPVALLLVVVHASSQCCGGTSRQRLLEKQVGLCKSLGEYIHWHTAFAAVCMCRAEYRTRLHHIAVWCVKHACYCSYYIHYIAVGIEQFNMRQLLSRGHFNTSLIGSMIRSMASNEEPPISYLKV